MKVVSTEALTKLIQLVKSAFVKVEDVLETQEVTLATVATSGSYNDLTDKPNLRNIGEIVASTIPLSDSGLHLLDGALINGSGSYADFVTYISGLVSDYPDLFETEANWQTSVTTYGVCGKFVYDSVNNTVRLPKITGFTEGTTDFTALGDLIEAGLPNITGTVNFKPKADNSASSGAFSHIDATSYSEGSGNVKIISELSFDASRSSSIYGNSTTVQPQAIKVLYYICIATSTKTDIEVDIDEIVTDLNGKADTDLSNINTSGKSFASKLGMPSSRYIDLTLGASGTNYTAPANGWVLCTLDLTANSWLSILSFWAQNSNKNGYVSILRPLKKGENFSVEYSGYLNTIFFRFIYAEGEENV